MSGFLGTTSGTAGVGIQHSANDIRLISEPFDMDFYAYIVPNEGWVNGGYAAPWWPGSQLDASGHEWLEAVVYDRPDLNTGAVSKRGFSGYARDVNGVIIAGATMRLFRTSDGLMTCQCLSGADGFFTLDTPFYPDAHFYTAHKADVPEIAGASPSNLIAG